jgi:2-polyprenyl-6-methoxyphenol hydroxylase-like FAD-dependent oxidoreductase
MGVVIGGRSWRIADFSYLPGRGNFIAMMPQWEFLDFLAQAAGRLAAFELRMNAEAVDIVEADGRVAGVRLADGSSVAARLVIAADGRGSKLRGAAGLAVHDLGAPIDVMWFRVPKPRTDQSHTQGFVDRGEMIVAIDRGDYFQAARVIAKGSADTVRSKGIEAFRHDVAQAAPVMAGGIEAIATWDDVKLLSVSLDRLDRWFRPGLLAIGDAAHAMSPVGGVGINLAIQDAVAAANILCAPMLAGESPDRYLIQVQERRMMPVRVIQRLQRFAHRNVIGAALGQQQLSAPLPLRLLDRVPWLRRIPARLVGLGVRREHIRSPQGT